MKNYLITNKDIYEITTRHIVAIETDTVMEPGGMIILSTKITKKAAGSVEQIINWLKSKMQRYYKRVSRTEKVLERVLARMSIETGYGVGSPFHGKYYDKKVNETYSEDSFAVDMRGVPFEAVKECAIALRDAYHQTAVLVIDHKTNTPHLLENVD